MSLIKSVSAADSGGHDPQKQKRPPNPQNAEKEKKPNWKISPGILRSSASALEQSSAQKINPLPLFTNKSSRILPARNKAPSGGMSTPHRFYRLQAKLFQKLNAHREKLLRKVPPAGVSLSSESISKVKRTKLEQEQKAGPKRKEQQ